MMPNVYKGLDVTSSLLTTYPIRRSYHILRLHHVRLYSSQLPMRACAIYRQGVVRPIPADTREVPSKCRCYVGHAYGDSGAELRTDIRADARESRPNEKCGGCSRPTPMQSWPSPRQSFLSYHTIPPLNRSSFRAMDYSRSMAAGVCMLMLSDP